GPGRARPGRRWPAGGRRRPRCRGRLRSRWQLAVSPATFASLSASGATRTASDFLPASIQRPNAVRLWAPRVSATGAVEDPDVTGLEYDLVVGPPVLAGHERGDVRRLGAVTAFGAVEHDVLRVRVARVADPERVGARGQRRQQVQRGGDGGAAGDPGDGRAHVGLVRAQPV